MKKTTSYMDQGQGQSQNLELGVDLLLVVCSDFGL